MSLPTEGQHWTILCPGPSLWLTETIEVPGPSVAVNYAIKCGVDVDYWCVNDYPKHYESILRNRSWIENEAGPIVWALHGATSWLELGFKVHPTGGGSWFHERMPFPWRKYCYINKTIATALGRVIMHQPSKITVYGCDMVGEAGYDRWDDEREQVFGIIGPFQERLGIEFDFVKLEGATVG